MIETVTSPAEALLPPAKAGRRFGMALAVVASAMVHAALFVLVLNHLASELGGRGHLLDAIEIEVVDASARDSVVAAPVTDGGNAASTGIGGMPQQAHQSAAAPPAAQPIAPRALDATPVADADLVATPKQDNATADDPRREQTPSVHTGIATASIAAPTEAADAGASSTSLAAAAQPGSSRSAAAPGDVARFNAEVRKALGRNRPRGWPAGHLTLAFSVSDAGRVENAELTQASASARLNQLTLEWIASIDMPVPPQGMPAAERRYAIPITVR